jgi:ribosomal-protein-alanine N-acetyltransferase
MSAASGEIRVRTMAEGDLDRVVEIAASLATAPQWPRSAYVAAIALNVLPRRIALVAEFAGEVAGFAVASLVGPGADFEAELESIAVAKSVQGHGIGAALLARLVTNLGLVGAEKLALEVRESNAAALGLYERAGFREVGRRRGYYRDPVEDAVLLRLDLT